MGNEKGCGEWLQQHELTVCMLKEVVSGASACKQVPSRFIYFGARSSELYLTTFSPAPSIV